MLCHIEQIKTKEVQVLANLEVQVEKIVAKEVLVPAPPAPPPPSLPSLVAAITEASMLCHTVANLEFQVVEIEIMEVLVPEPLAPLPPSLPSPLAAPLAASMLCRVEQIETKEIQILANLECQVEKIENKEVLIPVPLAPPLASLPSPLAAPMVASMLCHIELIETREVQVLAALEFQVERRETKEVLVPEPSLVAAVVVPAFRFPKSGWMVPQCSRCRRRIHSDLNTVHCRGAVMTPVWFTPPEDWVSC